VAALPIDVAPASIVGAGAAEATQCSQPIFTKIPGASWWILGSPLGQDGGSSLLGRSCVPAGDKESKEHILGSSGRRPSIKVRSSDGPRRCRLSKLTFETFEGWKSCRVDRPAKRARRVR
jgi:hypothetical protein